MLTTEQYKQGLKTLPSKDKTKIFEVLRLHFRARNHSITATEIKNALGLSSIQAVNSRYTKLGKHFAETSRVKPEQRNDGTKIWWPFVSIEGRQGSYILLIMQPALVAALKELGFDSNQLQHASITPD